LQLSFGIISLEAFITDAKCVAGVFDADIANNTVCDGLGGINFMLQAQEPD
jgi:hypothetical protein